MQFPRVLVGFKERLILPWLKKTPTFLTLFVLNKGAHMDECDCGFVRRLPVLPAHHGLRAEDWTGLALPVCSADCSKHY